MKTVNDIWPHLQYLDQRFFAVINYLQLRIADKTIVDLDCGDARILKHMLPLGANGKYIGNDVLESPYWGGVADRYLKHTEFYLKKDSEMEFEKVDILMSWGIGGYELSDESVESSTLTESIKRIADKHDPKFIVLEAIWDFDSILEGLVKYFSNRYITRIDERLQLKEIREYKRHVILLEKL